MNEAVPFEVYNDVMSPLERQAVAKRNQFFANSGRIAPRPAGDVLPRIGVLGPGSYPGGTLVNNSDVSGLGLPEVGPLTLNGVAVIRDCALTGQVTIGPGAVVRLLGCRIDRLVVVAAGGRLIVAGSVFTNGQSFIANAGAAANCGSVGNVGWLTGPTPHVNVTLVFET